MSVPCYNHSRAEAVGVCFNCGMTFCNDCLRQVGHEVACTKCAPTVADPMQMGGQSALQFSKPTQTYRNLGAETSKMEGDGPSGRSKTTYFIAVILASVVGLIGSILVTNLAAAYPLIMFIGVLYAPVGYCVGFSTWLLLGKGLFMDAITSVIIFLATAVAGYIVYVLFLSSSMQALHPQEYHMSETTAGTLTVASLMLVAAGLIGGVTACWNVIMNGPFHRD